MVKVSKEIACEHGHGAVILKVSKNERKQPLTSSQYKYFLEICTV